MYLFYQYFIFHVYSLILNDDVILNMINRKVNSIDDNKMMEYDSNSYYIDIMIT